ncbi:MAG: glycosyltransferase family 39 protein [Pirellulales bacterium]|nr:glycosyltransferase family 39 protein [Pirellulales bacterium]
MNEAGVGRYEGLPLLWEDLPAGPLGQRRERRLLWALLILGVAARAVRYGLKFPLWDDECFLMANLLDRDYAGLTKPLNYWQICPVGFLWLELALVRLLGFCEYVVRLPSFVASVAGLFLFRHMAGRLLGGAALVLAVGTYAVAYPMLRYAAEAKPYGVDLFLALVVLAVAVEWWARGATHARWLWLLAALIPVAVLVSYPVVFVGGAASLFIACALWRRGRWWDWAAWVAYNAALVGAFGAIFLVSVQPQSAAELDTLRAYWDRGFPPLGSPLAFIAWFFNVHTGQLLAYPFGGDNGGSTLSFLLCVVALVVLARRRQYMLLLLCLGPLALTFAAAVIGRYPYGGMVRFNIYMGPIVCLLVGLGLAAALAPRQPRTAARGRTGLLVAAGALMLVAAGSIARDVAFPAKAAADMRFRDFARWFWFDMAHDGEVVCLNTDLGKDFSPEEFRHGFSAMYLCNQRIYSPRHARGEPPRWDRVSADWPLRCVQFYSSTYPLDRDGLDRWVASMRERYTLVARERLPFACFDKRETKLRAMAYVELFKFVPKTTGPAEP